MEHESIHYSHLQTSWKALYYFNIYRLLLSGSFVALYWADKLPQTLGVYSQALFTQVSHVYLFCALLFGYFILLRRPGLPLQVVIHTLADIALLTILIYASLGLESGLGMLLVIAIAGNSILTTRKMAVSIAAVASLAILAEETYAEFTQFFPQINYVHAGLLGITFFIISIIGQALAAKVKQSEELARKRAIDLKHLLQLNEFIVHRMQTGILTIDSEGRIELCNQAAQNMFNSDHVRGRKLEQVSVEIHHNLEKWKHGGSGNNVIINLEESGIDIQLTFSRLSIESDSDVLVFMEDIASLKQSVQQMKVASLGRLAASIAHEVRNPLGAISNAGQLLSESSSISAEDKKLSAIIQQHSKRVNNIIENVMSISRRERSIPQDIALYGWLKDFIEQLQARQNFDNTNVTLTTDGRDLCVKMDSVQLEQVLSNLCENALRYSKRKPLIELKCGTRRDTARPYLDVIDQGNGISDQVAGQLFEPFFTTEREGSGMGLYIARELCDANHADLTLYSNTDRGCCFRITFPHPDKQYKMI